MPLVGLRHGIQQRWLAALDDGQRAADGRTELARIVDRPFGVPSHAFRELSVVDIGLVESRCRSGTG